MRRAELILLLAAACRSESAGATVEEQSLPSQVTPTADRTPYQLHTATVDDLLTEVERASRPIVMDFWSIDCAPCTAGMPELHSALQREEVRLLTVSVDEDPESLQRASKFARELGVAEGDAWVVPASGFHDSEAAAALFGRKFDNPMLPTVLVFHRGLPATREFSGLVFPAEVQEAVRSLRN